MEIQETHIAGLKIIKPKVFGDERGYFMESYNKERYQAAGIKNDFVQDNEAFSSYGVLRGLHYQLGEFAQAKLVRVIQGEVLDVAVDLRPDSKTYGEHYAIRLSAENKTQFLVPRGFAHGYVVLSETALFAYKCDNLYQPSHEGGIHYNDPQLNIDWIVATKDLVVSSKDQVLPHLGQHKQ